METTTWTLADLQQLMESLYPRHLQEDWDKNGLIVGDPESPIRRIILAVDPVSSTAQEAVDGGYDLMITHHPLYLRGTSFVSREDYKGRIVHDFIKNDVALMNAHTNADSAARGVAWALGQAAGIDGSPFEVQDEDTNGVERGLGRIGELSEAMPLREFATRIAKALPQGPHGVFVGTPVGRDLDMLVKKVAVSGGAGDSFLSLVSTLGADVYVTADLRHHPASEHLENGGPALICGSHWATEWLWLPILKQELEDEAEKRGIDVEVHLSRIVTEPWVCHIATSD
ncbi:MAG: Nif3-like dinuclear metal center hexameric protein [Actinomycetaceae bacterium]|nr:Nif3-like dinuclear metal center hexameric protein [Actinomycetaceae bacterium]